VPRHGQVPGADGNGAGADRAADSGSRGRHAPAVTGLATAGMPDGNEHADGDRASAAGPVSGSHTATALLGGVLGSAAASDGSDGAAPGSRASSMTGPLSGQPGSHARGYHEPTGTMHGANQTMIVADGIEDGLGEDGYPAWRQARRQRQRGYGEPWLQKWLFSRRVLILVAVVIVGLGVWWFTDGQYFTVPSVARMALSSARSELTGAGLTVTVGAPRHSDTVPAGDVISTDPAGGSRATHGGAITVIPSLGPVLVTVPQVTGQNVSLAKASLVAAGLTHVEIVSQASASIPAKIVISTNPAAYQHWPVNKPVQLVVSAGPPLPDFVGQQLGVAQQAGSSGGYSIDAVQATGSTQPSGTVVKQSPAPGTPITPGEVVTVYVSPGAAMVSVPDVQGMNVNQATSILTAAGFKVSEEDLGFGQKVISYSPTGTAPQGSTITIVVGFSF
jgi:beta-lactam-binding protein with PASTA domain